MFERKTSYPNITTASGQVMQLHQTDHRDDSTVQCFLCGEHSETAYCTYTAESYRVYLEILSWVTDSFPSTEHRNGVHDKVQELASTIDPESYQRDGFEFVCRDCVNGDTDARIRAYVRTQGRRAAEGMWAWRHLGSTFVDHFNTLERCEICRYWDRDERPTGPTRKCEDCDQTAVWAIPIPVWDPLNMDEPVQPAFYCDDHRGRVEIASFNDLLDSSTMVQRLLYQQMVDAYPEGVRI
jgi:hypothetical protein